MAKDERDRIAVGKQSSKGKHGGNRAGGNKDAAPEHSNPNAGDDPHRGGRPSNYRPASRPQAPRH